MKKVEFVCFFLGALRFLTFKSLFGGVAVRILVTLASFIDHPRINDYMSAESIQKSWMEEPLSDPSMSDSLSPHTPHLIN